MHPSNADSALSMSQDHRLELLSLQPSWVVGEGGPSGLSSEDRAALAQGHTPASYVAFGVRQWKEAAGLWRWMLYGGVLVLSAAVAMGALALLQSNGEWLGGALFCGLFGLFGTVLGGYGVRSSRRGLGVRNIPVAMTQGRIVRKFCQGGVRFSVHFVQLDQLTLGVPSRPLWNALREGEYYRCWWVQSGWDRNGNVVWIEP